MTSTAPAPDTAASPQAWPPANGCTTIVVPRDQCINAATYSTSIAAPASLVFSVIRDSSTYPTWNTFVPRVDITSHPSSSSSSSESKDKNEILQNGTAFTFHAVMNPAKPQSANATALAVTDVSTPQAPTKYVPDDMLAEDPTFTSDLSRVYRISWREGAGSLLSHGFRCERFHEVIVRGEKSCEVRTWENQASLLAYAVRYIHGETIKLRFKDWCEGLKKYCEEHAQK